MEISAKEYELAHDSFKLFGTGGNFFFSRGAVATALVAFVVAYLIFKKWWLLGLAVLCLLDWVRKEGFKEGYIHGFEYGFERAWRVSRGWTDEDESDES